MLHYLKFFHYYLLVLIACTCLLFADYFIVFGFIMFISTYIFGDAFLGDDISTPSLNNKRVIDTMLYGSVPLCALLLGFAAWLVTPENWIIISYLSQLTSYDFQLAKTNTNSFELAIVVIFCGLMLSGIATVVGHELVHRIGKKRDVCIGRWLMSLSLDANFSIEHVYHHHATVATEQDPVTAPRGRNVYTHVILAIYGTHKSAWHIEKKRLIRKKQHLMSYHNAVIRGYLMSLTYLTLVMVLAGWQACILLTLIGATAKFFLEVVNYMEHYGLVRHPKQAVKPKHSWNSNRKISTWAMFNLPRHSHHHTHGAIPFEKLEPMPDAPMMISGYISTIGIALIPPLWFALMKPKLEHWDRTFANKEELEILEQQRIERNNKPILAALFY